MVSITKKFLITIFVVQACSYSAFADDDWRENFGIENELIIGEFKFVENTDIAATLEADRKRFLDKNLKRIEEQCDDAVFVRNIWVRPREIKKCIEKKIFNALSSRCRLELFKQMGPDLWGSFGCIHGKSLTDIYTSAKDREGSSFSISSSMGEKTIEVPAGHFSALAKAKK